MSTVGHARGLPCRYFFTVLFDSPTSSQHDQAFIGKFMRDLIAQRLLLAAVGTPAGPEFEQDDLPFDRLIVELLAVKRLSAKVRSGFALLGSEGRGGNKQGEKCD
jgi:hypothetical protein